MHREAQRGDREMLKDEIKIHRGGWVGGGRRISNIHFINTMIVQYRHRVLKKWYLWYLGRFYKCTQIIEIYILRLKT